VTSRAHPTVSSWFLLPTSQAHHLFPAAEARQAWGRSEVATTRRTKHCRTFKGSSPTLYLELIFAQLRPLHGTSSTQVPWRGTKSLWGTAFRCPPACTVGHLKQAIAIAVLNCSLLVTFGHDDHCRSLPTKIFHYPNPILSYPILSYPILSYPILSCSTLLYSTLLYSTLLYPPHQPQAS